ncbi:MAG TPA: galactosyldiacylglycerol synthase [Hydrogenophaga sp.]|jgi:UDP-N-acetylglucosamine:LPS N-acetylglucosamine transferase|uniref:glycosyltransferase n=1 Tax=Hydrogenophaga TaxID=47420 RepID=UPI0008AD4F69|nr:MULTISPECIES: glycosyltransferase [Hydrogenophaga]MBU4183799.1 galactosyldiacylglycerol synthase [Gammaproteobacteria bacterium]OGA78070.1 MAG: galactosyldiacylglycerol synthase [Burkholderiales bacterium GWE1_65_30]OGA94421.1 MAG: galactosyldiacylglycerol synthase [Burkholderiales bacterium GWF1_66_17]OGB36775.1 MAG: galactosyldiacylglycerol synthase [Burkholderiales bacterium RIFCSPLOWO2_02_FULL_66_35]MBU4282404.1 galactosyldiacylglycerol synthase [Gammaproteobacteria bacterium]
MTTVDLIYFNAGGGHRASALALQSVLREQGRPWEVRLVNLFEVLDPSGRFKRLTGKAPEDWYNQRLARGWTLGMAHELKILQGLIRLAHPTLVRKLRRHWQRTRPDLVVSLIPNFNRALYESLIAALPGVPYVTVLTDLADLPPHFWIERDQSQHFVCGTPRAVQQALALGHSEDRVHASSGMILRPEFYRPATLDRAEEQRRLGLDPQRPTGLVLFGGHGSKTMLGIAERLSNTQLILVCGHNQALAERLRAQPSTARHVVIGFSSDIPAWMRLADFFIGKPGPGSVSEAVQLGLPVIVVNNAWTMPQERYNADWVREQRLGIVMGSFRGVDSAVAQLLDGLDAYRARVDRIQNRALFEIPDILARVLAESGEEAADGAVTRPADQRRPAQFA